MSPEIGGKGRCVQSVRRRKSACVRPKTNNDKRDRQRITSWRWEAFVRDFERSKVVR
jgi:hypothetical protein